MKTGPFASYVVIDPKGIHRTGEHLPQGTTFGGRATGVHVSRWLAAGRIREVAAKRKISNRRTGEASRR